MVCTTVVEIFSFPHFPAKSSLEGIFPIILLNAEAIVKTGEGDLADSMWEAITFDNEHGCSCCWVVIKEVDDVIFV